MTIRELALNQRSKQYVNRLSEVLLRALYKYFLLKHRGVILTCDTCPESGVKGRINLIKDVEWHWVTALNSKNEAKSYNSGLTT